MLTLHGVCKTYPTDAGPVHALTDVSMTVADGEFVYLVGPSGSGKSTLLKLFTREVRPDVGTVTVDGIDVTGLSRRKVPMLRRTVGTVFQHFELLEDQSVAGNVAFPLQVLGYTRPEIRRRVATTLDLVGLADKAAVRPGQLSGGQQQRVALARAMVTGPKVLLADEPTGNLDPETSVGIVRLLATLNAAGTTVVMATHDHHIVDRLRRRVVQVTDGTIVRDQADGRYDPTVTAAVRRAAPGTVR